MLLWSVTNKTGSDALGAACIPRVLLVGRTHDESTLPYTSIPGEIAKVLMGGRGFIAPSANIIAMEKADTTLHDFILHFRNKTDAESFFKWVHSLLGVMARLLYVLQASCLFEHRDLHLGNVMFKQTSATSGVFYLIDFDMSVCTVDGKDWLYYEGNFAEPFMDGDGQLRVPEDLYATSFVNECPRLGGDLAQMAWNLRSYVPEQWQEMIPTTWWGQALQKIDLQYEARSRMPGTTERDIATLIARCEETLLRSNLSNSDRTEVERFLGKQRERKRFLFYSLRYFYDSALDFVPETVLSNHYNEDWHKFAPKVTRKLDRSETVRNMYNVSKHRNVVASQQLLEKHVALKQKYDSGDSGDSGDSETESNKTTPARSPRRSKRAVPPGAEELHDLFSATLYNFL